MFDQFQIEAVDDQSFLIDRRTGKIAKINKTARIVIELLQSGLSRQQVVRIVADSQGASQNQVRHDIQSLIASLEGLPSETCGLLAQEPHVSPSRVTHPGVEPTRYRLNGCSFSIAFASQTMATQVKRLFAPFTVEPGPEDSVEFNVMVSRGNSGFSILLDGHPVEDVQTLQEVHGFLRGIIIGKVYSETTQMVMLHAAAVSKNGKAVVLAGPSGSGKSTLTLTLALKGCSYFGDDTIGVDLASNSVLPLPTALNLKHGSWRLFESSVPELIEAEPFRSGHKLMKAVSLPNPRLDASDPVSIDGVVFIQYAPQCEPSFTRLGLEDVLVLANESGVVFHPNNQVLSPTQFLHWLQQTPCYRLVYPNSAAALRQIETAFW